MLTSLPKVKVYANYIRSPSRCILFWRFICILVSITIFRYKISFNGSREGTQQTHTDFVPMICISFPCITISPTPNNILFPQNKILFPRITFSFPQFDISFPQNKISFQYFIYFLFSQNTISFFRVIFSFHAFFCLLRQINIIPFPGFYFAFAQNTISLPQKSILVLRKTFSYL